LKLNYNELIKDLLEADPTMTRTELFTHCEIITIHNKQSINDLRKAFQNNKQLKEINEND